MKTFGLTLLFVVAAVQARSADVQVASSASVPAQLGENPWLVHLRLAYIFNDGNLKSCVGSLVNDSWVLTSAKCVAELRYVWIRYAALNPIFPGLVTETRTAFVSNDDQIALISIDRAIEFNDNISAVALPEDDEVPASAKFCGYSPESDVLVDEELACSELSLESDANGNIVGVGAPVSPLDLGAPLVKDGVQVGILVDVNENGAVFLNPAKYRAWIEMVSSSNA